MNKAISINILLSLTILLTHNTEVYCQLLQDGFETERLASTDWEKNFHGQGYSILLDSQTFYSGNKSMKISKNPNSEGETAYTFKTLSFKDEQPKKLIFSGRIKTEDVDKWANLWAIIKDSSGNVLYYEDEKDFSVGGTTDWTDIQLPVLIDSRSAELKVGIGLEGSGTAWFDSLSFGEMAKRDSTPRKALEYLKAAIDTIKDNSLMRDSIDWDDYSKQLLVYTDGVKTIRDTYPIIRYGIYMLSDNHSRFLTPPDSLAASTNPDTSSQAANYEKPTASYLGNNTGYISVPAFSGAGDLSNEYATILQKAIRKVDKEENICGWVIDLRNNQGGNMYPMIAGLGPILEEGKLGEFHTPDTVATWQYVEGKAIGEHVNATVKNPYKIEATDIPVAVLIGPKTASSGEAVAISFMSKPNTKTFGLPSGGYTTGNSAYDLSDGATLIIAGAVMADRTGKAYYGKIYPDEEISFSKVEKNDEVVNRAIDWLSKQNVCQQ